MQLANHIQVLLMAIPLLMLGGMAAALPTRPQPQLSSICRGARADAAAQGATAALTASPGTPRSAP